jgi:2-oxoglutarate ferredoxin oxidoreductase subunit alpha
MSPSTGVLTFLSKHAKDFGIVADQAEDEIAAINAVIGAWFAGGRGLASTSGGGFALMTEGISLAGISESPAVIHIAQRPGPGTGLPTRTEQGDLNLVLYAGHGEFPRIILAPGSTEEAFILTQRAFNLADRYQSPVFILTDQYLIDTIYNIPLPKTEDLKVDKYIIRTDPEYKRYMFSEDGISPRGIPDFGSGLVGLDSHEHDEEGHISEDLEHRSRMMEKRLLKLETIKKDIIAPKFIGKEDCRLLLIGWGSTLNVVTEALQILNNDDVAFLHFSQIYPLHEDTGKFLEKAKITAVIENNATGQFAQLIHGETGIPVDRNVLKYTGLAFTVEEVIEKVEEILGGEIL